MELFVVEHEEICKAYQAAFTLDWDLLCSYLSSLDEENNVSIQYCKSWLKIKEGEDVDVSTLPALPRISCSLPSKEQQFCCAIAFYYENIGVCSQFMSYGGTHSFEEAVWNCEQFPFSKPFIKVAISLVQYVEKTEILDFAMCSRETDVVDWLLDKYEDDLDYNYLAECYHCLIIQDDNEEEYTYISKQIQNTLEAKDFTFSARKERSWKPKHLQNRDWVSKKCRELNVVIYAISTNKQWDVAYRIERTDEEGSHKLEYCSDFNINTRSRNKRIEVHSHFLCDSHHEYIMSHLVAGNDYFAYIDPKFPRWIEFQHFSGDHAPPLSIDHDTMNIKGLFMSPSALFIGVISQENLVKIWNTKEHKLVHELGGDEVWELLIFSACDRMFALAGDDRISLYDNGEGVNLLDFTVKSACEVLFFTNKHCVVQVESTGGQEFFFKSIENLLDLPQCAFCFTNLRSDDEVCPYCDESVPEPEKTLYSVMSILK